MEIETMENDDESCDGDNYMYNESVENEDDYVNDRDENDNNNLNLVKGGKMMRPAPKHMGN